jgi:uncharacterized protein (TIGR00269 family)
MAYERNLTPAQFKEFIERKSRRTMKETPFTRNDRGAVAFSGGKDSTTCLYILKQLGYKVEAITIDAAIGNYTKQNLANIKKMCRKYKIKLHIISFRKEFGMSLCYIRSLLKSKGYEVNSCMLCGILKRYLLNKYSRKLKFKFLATGHNLDDEAQAFLMNVFRNDFPLARKQGPCSGSPSKKFVPRIKPLYFISEADIAKYSKLMKFPVIYTPCPCSYEAHRGKHETLLNELEKDNPGIKYCILRFQEKMKSQLKKEKTKEVKACSKCGEPARGNICKSCEIFEKLKS